MRSLRSRDAASSRQRTVGTGHLPQLAAAVSLSAVETDMIVFSPSGIASARIRWSVMPTNTLRAPSEKYCWPFRVAGTTHLSSSLSSH